jgi:hypothetical protein
VSVELNTARGRYRLKLAAPLRNTPDEVILSLAYERADGLERVGFLCSVARELVDTGELGDSGVLLERVAPWFEREFEHTRETALKSIRTDRRPMTVRFDGDHPGPFLR